MRNDQCPMYDCCHLDCDECRSAAFYMNEDALENKETDDDILEKDNWF